MHSLTNGQDLATMYVHSAHSGNINGVLEVYNRQGMSKISPHIIGYQFVLKMVDNVKSFCHSNIGKPIKPHDPQVQ